jgi:hypothetical protein
MPDNIMQPAPPVYENRSPTLAKLADALCKAQGQMEGAAKDSVNPHFRNKYADLAAVWDAIRKPLAANGLSIVQFPRTVQQGVEIETTLLHTSGEFLRDSLWLPCSKVDAQGIGSAITYGRRYALMAVCGIAPVDDDGEAAVATTPRNAEPPPARNSSANGRRMAAEEPDLVDNSRAKGTLPAGKKPDPQAERLAAAKKNAKEWTTDQVVKMNESELSIAELRKLEEDNRERIDWMQGELPEQFDRFYNVFNLAIERAMKRGDTEEEAA